MKQQSGYRATWGDTQPPQALLDAWQPSRRDHCGESDLPARGEKGVVSPVTLYPPPCRTSGKKGGVAPSTSTPLVRRAVSPGEGGTREAQPRIAFPQRRGESVPTRVQ